MNKITLHQQDLETILTLVKYMSLNGYSKTINIPITIIESKTDNAIGSCLDVEIPVTLNGETGIFKKSIVDESK